MKVLKGRMVSRRILDGVVREVHRQQKEAMVGGKVALLSPAERRQMRRTVIYDSLMNPQLLRDRRQPPA